MKREGGWLLRQLEKRIQRNTAQEVGFIGTGGTDNKRQHLKEIDCQT